MPNDAGNAKTLYLIDGHAQFYRAYHAIRTGMSSPVTHEPTNMTYGFVAMILKLMRDYAPDYVAVVIDVGGDQDNFRAEIYPEYKANRTETPEDFRPQMQRCLAVLDQMNIPVLGVGGVEADDVIATLTRRLRAERPDLHIRVVSRDKDLTQLVGDGVELFDVHKDESVTPAQIFKTEGVRSEHVVDILALMGDSIDNIPGVAGVGPKTAAKLILQYGSIDNLLAHLDEIKGKRREAIEAARDRLSMNRELVELKDDVDVAFDLDAARCEVDALPVEDLLATFRELAFTQHRDTLKDLVGGGEGGGGDGGRRERSAVATIAATAAPPATDAAGFADGLFGGLHERGGAGDDADAPRPPAGDYRAVTTPDALAAFADEVRAAGFCAIDVELDGASPVMSNICGIALSVAPETGVYVPTRSPDPGAHLDVAGARAVLRDVLEDEAVSIVGHDVKRAMIALRLQQVALRGPLFDTMVASYVIDATRTGHDLDVLALAVLRYTCVPRDELLGRGRARKRFDEIDVIRALPAAAERPDLALRLRDAFVPQITAMGLDELFRDVELPLVAVLAELEHNGIRVDPDELDRQRERLTARTDELLAAIAAAAPHPFNPDSPKQLAAALFNKPDDDPPGLGLKVLKRGKTGPSTDVEVLEKLAAEPAVESRVPDLLIEYRKLTKLVNTYLVSLKDAINPATGRVHASFNQTGAATGRLSSSDPNLQNIPIRTDIGREIRRAFVAEPGRVLITADYSQIELRILAHLAEDPALMAAFDDGSDIHTAVAAEVYGVAPGAVTPEQRTSAKMVNFGIVYGITAFGLARRLGPGVSNQEASRIIADYKARFTRIDDFSARCVQQAKEQGYVETILKRRRRIPQIAARNPMQRALGERMAINTVVQGSAADLIKIAMIDLHERLPAVHPDARMLLQIHDELVFEVPAGDEAAVEAFVRERMEGAMTLRVPLVVDTAHSTSWIDAK